MIIYNELYKAIKQHLNTVTEIKHIDWFNDQYRNYETSKGIPRGQVFVEILDPVNWNQMTPGQNGTVRVRLHCVLYDVKDSPVPALEFTQKVMKSLQRKDMFDDQDEQLTTEMIRSESNMPKRYNQVKVTHVTFTAELYDNTLSDATQPVNNPTFTINS